MTPLPVKRLVTSTGPSELCTKPMLTFESRRPRTRTGPTLRVNGLLNDSISTTWARSVGPSLWKWVSMSTLTGMRLRDVTDLSRRKPKLPRALIWGSMSRLPVLTVTVERPPATSTSSSTRPEKSMTRRSSSKTTSSPNSTSVTASASDANSVVR